jgi:mRNA interferase RelE/StbE
MKVEFKASFARDLKKIKDKELLKEVRELIEATESSQGLSEIPNLKKLRVKGHYYRVKLGDYRAGLIIEGNAVTFVRFLHRSEIYRYFP